MRLCTCGHRRHDPFGGCFACDCFEFEEAKSGTEESAPPASEVPVAASLAPRPDIVDTPRGIDAAVRPDRTRVGEGPGSAPAEAPDLPVDTFTHSVTDGWGTALATLDETLLESRDAFRCASCGSRSYRPERCCKTIMDPVRVDIHTREVDD